MEGEEGKKRGATIRREIHIHLYTYVCIHVHMRNGLGIFLENCEKPAATRD